MSDTQIKVGVVYVTHGDAGGAGKAVDTRAQAEAMVAYINSHGKVGGRELSPVYQEFDLAKAQSGSDESTKACVALTEDTKVFAVLSTSGLNNECLIKHQTPIIASGMAASRADPEFGYAKHGQYLYAPSSFTAEDQTRVAIDGLGSSGFFTRLPEGAAGPAKIGVIIFGEAKADIQPDVDAALARHSLKVANWGFVENVPTSVPGIVLRFKSEGITHILTPGYSPIAVASAAKAQKYHPLYGLDSRNVPGLLGGLIPPDQLRGAQAVGWQPFTDVDSKQDRGLTGGNAELCLTIMRDAGLPTTPTDLQSATAYCDDFLVLQKSLEGAGQINLSALAKGYAAVGDWDSPATFAARLGPDRHAGAAGYRPLGFDAGCSCFRYTGPIQRLTTG